MLRNYLTIAYRNLRRRPGYAFINVAGLAVGLAVCLLIALYVRHELSYDDFHEKADRIFQVLTVSVHEDRQDLRAYTPLTLASALEATFPGIERIVSMKPLPGIVRRGEHTFEEELLFVTPDFFEVFSFDFLKGNPATALDAPNGVVLTREMARKYFGREQAMGKRLSIRLGEEFYDFTVTGIAKTAPSHSSIQYDILLPFSKLKSFWRPYANPSWHTLSPLVYVQLSSTDQAQALEAKFPAFVEEYVPEDFAGSMHFRLLPITATHLTPGVDGQPEPTSKPTYAYILSGIALFILLIACINFMTLSVGRSASRAQEVGMRKVLGAVRSQLMRQFWGEAFLLSFAALLLGLTLARALLPAFSGLIGEPLSAAWTDPVMLLVLVGLLLVVGFLAGSYPALYLSGFDPAQVLKGRSRSYGKNRITRGLIVGQFALSIFFIISTLFMVRQLNLLQTKDLGFDEEQVIRIATHLHSGESAVLLQRYRNALADQPAVQSLMGSWQPFGDGDALPNRLPTSTGGAEIKMADAEDALRVHALRTSYGVVETLGLDLKRGRGFSRAHGEDSAGASLLVNEALVEAFGWDDPLGKTLSVLFTVEDATVIGLVEDFHFQSLYHEIEPLVLHRAGIAPFNYVYVRMAPGDLGGTVALLEETWQEIAPAGLPFTFTFLDEHIEQQYRAEQRWTHIISWTAVLAILIACLGLFGLAAYAAERRTKEIGIRKVLGATVPSIVALLSKDFLKLVLVAFVIAVPVAYFAMSRWLQDFAYRIELGPWVFVGAGTLALVIALLTVSYQAVKAALANPVEALRDE